MLFTLAFILAMALYFGLVGWLLGRLGAGLPWPWWAVVAARRPRPWWNGCGAGCSPASPPLAPAIPRWTRPGGLRALAGGTGVSGPAGAVRRPVAPVGPAGAPTAALGRAVAGPVAGGGLLRQVSSTQPSGAPSRWAWCRPISPVPSSGTSDAPGLHRPLPGPHPGPLGQAAADLAGDGGAGLPASGAGALAGTLAQEAGRHGSSLLVGIPFMNLETRQYYNAAFVVGSEEVYFKRHLRRSGEFCPSSPCWGPYCRSWRSPCPGFQRRGAGARPLVRVAGHWGGCRSATRMPSGRRWEALPEADMLVNLSNDAWFGIPRPPSASPDRPPARPETGGPAARHQHGHFRPDRSPGRVAGPLPGLRGGGGDRRRATHDRHDLCPAGQRGRRGARPAGFGGWSWRAGAGFSRARVPGNRGGHGTLSRSPYEATMPGSVGSAPGRCQVLPRKISTKPSNT